jgi:hypothetical protein
VPIQKSPITRSGARRLGDEYQDMVALEMMVDWLEHAERYEWVQVEADNAGALDDVIARKQNGIRVYRQSKFAVHPDQTNNLWTWKALLKQAPGKKGQKLPSLLQDWATSLQHLTDSTSQMDAALYSNRDAAYEIRQACRQDDATLLNFASFPLEAREKIVAQLEGEENALHFFQHFHFLFNQPHLPELEDGLKRRFFTLGGSLQGWLSLKGELRSWVCNRTQPPPDGHIRLDDIRRAALWGELEGLAQEFAIPNDYVPPQAFVRSFAQKVLQNHAHCIVLSGSPGIGKSTFISYLYKGFRAKQIPVLRHHYNLGSNDQAPGLRFDHWRAATSLMHDIQRDHVQALGSLAQRNPRPGDLRTWLAACGAHYARENKTLVVLVDGLDHVWRDHNSVENLTRLLEYLLPPPDGIAMVFATQPVDNHQLSPILLRHAPRDCWVALPPLDEPAVEQWVRKHSSDFPKQAEQLQSPVVINRLTRALYRKGNGHPLHLYYTLKAIQERQLVFTEEMIEALPGCPHEGITAYYSELWHALPEESKAIMHLFTVSQYPWPSESIVACLDPQRHQIAQIRKHLQQVSHLLVREDLGLFPCHSSIFAFVSQLPEHQDYRKPYLQKTLAWLQQEAPDYWCWAYTWEIEAALGNDTSLSQGPDRQWVVNALVARRPGRDISNLLRSSMESALRHADLSRLVEQGLLLDYGIQACESYHDIREQLLYTQLCLEDEPYLHAWLFANLDDVTDGELVLLAEHALAQGDQQTFNRCHLLISTRLPRRKQQWSSLDRSWQQTYTPRLALDAMSADRDTVHQTLKLVIRNRRNQAIAQEILSLYCEHLRIWHNIDHLRTLLTFPIVEMQTKQTAQEEPGLLGEEAMLLRRQTALLALEEGLDVDELMSPAANGDPWVALYAAIRHLPNDHQGIIRLPDHTLLSWHLNEVFTRSFEIREFFSRAFFGFLANHLSKMGERNSDWLRAPGTRTWALRFLQELDAYAVISATKIQASVAMDFETLFLQLNHVAPPNYEDDDRAARYYYEAALQATVHIGLDLMIVAGAASEGIRPITRANLMAALSSPYCDRDVFLQSVVSRRRLVLDPMAVQWLLDDQDMLLRTSITPCAERAKRCAQLSALAILHQSTEHARRYIVQSAEHLLAHAYHKDMLFYNVLSALQCYAQTNAAEDMQGACWRWLEQLAPAIAAIVDYTDGDETRDFSGELAETLVLVSPEKLLPYYMWQCEHSDHFYVLRTLHAFLEHANLEDLIVQSLAITAIDQESLSIIARRAVQGDRGATLVQERLQTYLGTAAFAFTKSTADQRIPERGNMTTFDPASYPPARFDTSFEDLPSSIPVWIDYWAGKGKKNEVYHVLVEADRRGVDIACYDQLFLLALSLYGKAKAYPWLVKAHINGNGWNWHLSRHGESEQRWRLIQQHYPEKWLIFLEDTLLKRPLWLSGSFSHMEFRRLIEYCLFMGQHDLARRLVEHMVKGSLELVSMLPLPTPEWVRAI